MRRLALMLSFLTLAGLGFAQTQLTFWVPSLMNPPERAAIQKAVDAFNSQNPDITVKVQVVPGSETEATKLMTAVQSGTGPDIYYLDRFTVAQRAASGLLTDLTPYLQKEGVDLSGDYLPFAWAEVQFQGDVYGLPFDTDARALYYNKDMLQAAGVDPSQLDPMNGPISIDQLTQISDKVNKTDSSGAYTQLGFVPWLAQGWGYTWGFAYGGSFFDKAKCEVTPTNPGVVAGYKFVYDWAKRLDPQKVQTFVNTYWEWPDKGDMPDSQRPFMTQHVAMTVQGNWYLSTIADVNPGFNWGVTYIPTPDKSKTSWSGGWSLVIPKGDKNPDAAYKFVRFMAGQQGQRFVVEGVKLFPTWKSLLDDNSLYSGQLVFFKDLLPYSNSRPPLPVGALYWDHLATALQAMFLNSQTPEQALQAVHDAVQPQMATFCK